MASLNTRFTAPPVNAVFLPWMAEYISWNPEFSFDSSEKRRIHAWFESIKMESGSKLPVKVYRVSTSGFRPAPIIKKSWLQIPEKKKHTLRLSMDAKTQVIRRVSEIWIQRIYLRFLHFPYRHVSAKRLCPDFRKNSVSRKKMPRATGWTKLRQWMWSSNQ